MTVFTYTVHESGIVNEKKGNNIMPTTAETHDNLRGVRYGEIFVITHHLTHFRAAVYNSLGLNDLPQEQWQALNPDALKKEFKADAFIMNGPRQFMMDKASFELPAEGQVVSFGGLQMRQVGTLHIPLSMMIHGGERKPYMEHTIERKTEYVFSSGKLVYELIAPDGKVYIMQASAQIVDPTLTEDQLATLASRLKLPEQWQYRARRLDQNYILRADGVAHIIQDEFQNTYQRIDS